jgi:hypothetical protein
MIRSRSTLSIPFENIFTSSSFSSLSPIRPRSGSFGTTFSKINQLVNEDLNDKPGNGRLPGGVKLWKYLITLSIIGCIVYIAIIFFSQKVTSYTLQKTKYEKKDQVTVMINTFKRPDLMEGIHTSLFLNLLY